MSVPSLLIGGVIYDASFLIPHPTGRVLVDGVLLTPVPDKTEWDSHPTCGMTWEREVEHTAKTCAAIGNIPEKHKHNMMLCIIEHVSYRTLASALNGTEMDDDIAAREARGENTRKLKHSRKIARDGSLIHASAEAHRRMMAAIAVPGVLHDPRVWTGRVPGWEGYDPSLVAYVVSYLIASIAKLETFNAKRIAMGLKVKTDAEEDTGKNLNQMLSEWA